MNTVYTYPSLWLRYAMNLFCDCISNKIACQASKQASENLSVCCVLVLLAMKGSISIDVFLMS
ncbi:hypothetical protein T10_13259 [Trichinella papuae]|uniref:Uncharacterized protein n=1 Tax=Trichinella papuae TaxID=268474 RepID=A0A0V1N2F8_9BILA|nr:hypothetical protein T10_13259 [Trichinella papuae]